MAEADASQVQVGIGDDGGEVFVRTGVLAVEITEARPVILAELAGDPEFVHKARAVVQDHGCAAGWRGDGDLFDAVPVCPVDVEFQVPVFSGPKGHPANDKLREFDSSIGGRRSGKESRY